MNVLNAVLWVVLIGVVPGFCKELFFRGLLQRRLLKSWSAPAAIGVTSLIFAVVHLDPPAVALALVLGVWLGVIAWRTGSIVPTMVAHMAINSLWNIAQIVLRRMEVSPTASWIGCGVLFVVGGVGFVRAIRVLRRHPAWSGASCLSVAG
jgi:membrane protease YdiL (CAAX protease family)